MRKLLTLSIMFVLTMIIATTSPQARFDNKTNEPAATAPAADTVKVTIKSFEFTPKVVTVAPGTTVEWVNEGGRHSVKADKGGFYSDVMQNGAKFAFKFDKVGTYAYHCEFHGSPGGKEMAGKVIVKK
jgi:plastocyanin